jgi:hypothetical protein
MLNYYQLLATGNWKLPSVLLSAIRYTKYEVRKITYEIITKICKTKPNSEKSS